MREVGTEWLSRGNVREKNSQFPLTLPHVLLIYTPLRAPRCPSMVLVSLPGIVTHKSGVTSVGGYRWYTVAIGEKEKRTGLMVLFSDSYWG